MLVSLALVASNSSRASFFIFTWKTGEKPCEKPETQAVLPLFQESALVFVGSTGNPETAALVSTHEEQLGSLRKAVEDTP